MLKVLAILSPATVKRSTVKEEAMTPYWKLEKNNICCGDLKGSERLY